MKKFKIIVPGTTANLGPGFDTLGMALSLANEYLFEEANDTLLIDFGKYNELDNNLLYKSYEYLFNESNQKVLPVHITQIKQEIPTSRGLGSSAACIVAGLYAANIMLDNKYNEEELINFATKIEGHPDNVVPCIKGSLTSAIVDDDHVFYHKYNVANTLYFKVLIPDFELSTHIAREALPSDVSFRDTIGNIQRAINLIPAIESGNFKMIKACLKNSLHEVYRLPLITDSKELINYLCDEHHQLIVSGAGPTLLLISDLDDEVNLDKITLKAKWQIIKLKCTNNGVIIKEL